MRLWDAMAGPETALSGPDDDDKIRSVAFSADGMRLITASDDGAAARIWNVVSGAQEAIIRGLRQHVQDRRTLSPDGKRVLTHRSTRRPNLGPRHWVPRLTTWERTKIRSMGDVFARRARGS